LEPCMRFLVIFFIPASAIAYTRPCTTEWRTPWIWVAPAIHPHSSHTTVIAGSTLNSSTTQRRPLLRQTLEGGVLAEGEGDLQRLQPIRSPRQRTRSEARIGPKQRCWS
jgi:hypothetical protein